MVAFYEFIFKILKFGKIISKLRPKLDPVRNFAHRVCGFAPLLHHSSSDFKKHSFLKLTILRPIRRAPTIMVLSDYLVTIF